MNRRQLFTRLSAAFLAPLVRWAGKEDAAPTGYWAYIGRDGNWTGYPKSPPHSTEALHRLINELMRKQLAQAKPIPQEES